jgi:hypothetical protein
MILAFSVLALLLAALPAAMWLANLPLFRQPLGGLAEQQGGGEGGEAVRPTVSVLIPARDEEDSIGGCVETALQCRGVELEVIVLDDASTDHTPVIVGRLSQADGRVRLLAGKPLPTGWNGKQHACAQLAEAAGSEYLVFIDADVRLAPDSLRQLVAYQRRTGVGLLSAFPRQITETWLERWLIPMMHFVLLGFLPFARMRSDGAPNLAAGCGQLFLTRREAYQAAGTHAAIRASRHDGVKLPRAYRAAGLMTDVVDGTRLAECRMYRNAAEVTRGALKNATEGVASPRLIVPFTVLLLGCSLLPVVALVWAIGEAKPLAMGVAALAVILGHVPRVLGAATLRQSWFGACCHVPATVTFVILQWIALGNHLAGRRVAWRGRTES